ncbi:MAG: tetratricopeptide repeat protein, partial [Planctomycetota bacterium]
MRRLERFSLLLLALVVLWGCGATDKPMDEPAEATETAEMEEMAPSEEPAEAAPGDSMGAIEAEVGRRDTEKQFLIEQFLKFGDAARERGSWEEAQANYAKVLRLDPENAKARKRFDEASSILGVAPAEARAAMDDAVAERKVRREAAQAEISDLVHLAQSLEGQGNFAEAIRKYEKALLIAGLYPYYGDFSPNEAALKNMIARSTARKVKADKDRRDAELKEAQKIKELEERRVRQARKARIAALFRDANLAMNRNRFDLAREYAEQILRLDPGNGSAAKLRMIAREARMGSDEAEAQRNTREQWRRAFEELDRAAIPQVEAVVFPEEWLRVQVHRAPYAFSRGARVGADPRAREIENILATTMVNINFEETPLQDALSFLSGYANVNILVLPSVGEEKSEDELLVSLQAEDITVKAALELICVTKGLSYRVEKGV